MKKILQAILLAAFFALFSYGAKAQVTVTLTGPTWVYFGPAGADTATCGATVATECLTAAHLWNDILFPHYDLNGQELGIQLYGGSSVYPASFQGVLRGQYSPRQVVLVGNPANPSGVAIYPTAGDAVSCAHAMFSVIGLLLQASNGDEDLGTGPGCHVLLLGQIWFHPPASNGNFMTAGGSGALIEVKPAEASADPLGIQGTPSYWLNGATQCAMDVGDGGQILWNGNGQPNVFAVTLGNNTPVSQTAGFGCANDGGAIQAIAVGWYGTSTGPRYLVKSHGEINTGTNTGSGADQNVFPGSTAGVNINSNGYD